MTAGHGIVHSERSPSAERARGPELSGIQTWLALPEANEEMAPAFEHVGAADLPIVEEPGARCRVIMGELWGARAPTTTYAQTIYADIELAEGGAVPIDPAATERAVYLAYGDASIDGIEMEVSTLYILRPGITAILRSAGGGRIALCGGEDFATPRHVWWNFVSSSRDRINQAKEDWKAGNFPKVPGDDKEFIPIPEVPKTVSYP